MERIKNRKAQVCTVALVLLLASFLLFRSQEISEGIVRAVDLCLYTIIPSLFGMMVVSNLILSSKVFEKVFAPFSFITRYLFKLPGRLTSVLFISFIGGYPVGAKMIDSLYRDGQIDRPTAERMLSFCVNAGPAFVVSAISIPIFRSAQVGLIVLLAHLCSNLVVGFLGGLRCNVPGKCTGTETATSPPLTVRLVTSVNQSTRALCVVCAFIVAFSILLSILKMAGVQEYLTALLQNFIGPQNAKAVVMGIFEVTQGCSTIAGNSPVSPYLLAGITSFGGVCVHMQVSALLSGSGIRMKKYLFSRVVHLPFTLFFVWVINSLWSPVIDTFAPGESIAFEMNSVSPFASLFLVFLCIILLFTCRKSATIREDKK